MSARRLEVASNVVCTVNQEGDRGLIPRQLKEVLDLVSETNQRIEDCAVEWQAQISQVQWRILGTKPVDNEPWEQSVLARTYFTDKNLDVAFQDLLKYNKTFTNQLQNFIALVRGEQPTMSTGHTCNAQNQNSDCGLEEVSRGSSPQLPLDLPIPKGNPNTRKGRKNSASILNKAQQSLTDLIEAKINFDTKFLGLESTLNGSEGAISDPSLCLCQVCSRVLGSEMQDSASTNTRRSGTVKRYKKKTRRSCRIKYKRLNSWPTTRKNKVPQKNNKDSLNNLCSSDIQAAVTTSSV